MVLRFKSPSAPLAGKSQSDGRSQPGSPTGFTNPFSLNGAPVAGLNDKAADKTSIPQPPADAAGEATFLEISGSVTYTAAGLPPTQFNLTGRYQQLPTDTTPEICETWLLSFKYETDQFGDISLNWDCCGVILNDPVILPTISNSC